MMKPIVLLSPSGKTIDHSIQKLIDLSDFFNGGGSTSAKLYVEGEVELKLLHRLQAIYREKFMSYAQALFLSVF